MAGNQLRPSSNVVFAYRNARTVCCSDIFRLLSYLEGARGIGAGIGIIVILYLFIFVLPIFGLIGGFAVRGYGRLKHSISTAPTVAFVGPIIFFLLFSMLVVGCLMSIK
jgi:hypothetical protein